jgi:hypothetical protein
MKSSYFVVAIVSTLAFVNLPAHAQWLLNGVKAYYNDGNVGIGTTNPSQKLHVVGNLRVSGWIGNSGNTNLDFRTNNKRVLRIVWATDGINSSPNIIGGWEGNSVLANTIGATISGGGKTAAVNSVSGSFGAISGGSDNSAGEHAAIAGGEDNLAAEFCAVGGGALNKAQGQSDYIGGGESNETHANGAGCVIGGGLANDTQGFYATVPGGSNNAALGNYSFAAGRRGKANHHGSFVWSDSLAADFASLANNTFNVRATGGSVFYSGAAIGAWLPANEGAWNAFSDRNAKENVQPIDGKDVLEKLSSVPMAKWNYIGQDPGVRHIGPMAQDFRKAFNVGVTDTHISTIDADGVALAAIQGLHQIVKEKDEQISDLRDRVAKLEAMIEKLAEQNEE